MSKKKIAYIVLGIIAIILGYFNYFGEEQSIKELRKVVETKNAVYESEDYYVEAEKEFDYLDDKESVFEKAKARIKGMLLSGDNVILDKARNLILKSNIVGISPNGWEINASELKYEKETDLLVSQSLVSAKNEEKGIEISGNKFKTNIAMDYILLEDGVTVKNKLLSLMADKAEYSNETKKVVLQGNINIIGKKDEEGNSKLSGNFNNVFYDINERNLYADSGFEIKYSDITLIGDKLVLNDRDESFTVNGNVKIKYQDYIFDVDRIEKEAGRQIINVYGKIKGGNSTYNILADSGTYNIETKTFEIFGNVELTSANNEKLLADKFEYNLDTKDLNVYGNTIKYTSPTNNLEAEHFTYNIETKLVTTDKKFYAFNEKKENIKGTDLKYSLATKDFSAKNEIILGNSDYEIKGKNISYVEESGILTVPEDYELRGLKGDIRIIGKTIIYNRLTGDLKSDNELNLISNTAKMTGKNIAYNSKTTLGKITGPIVFEDKANNMTGSAKEILIKTGDYVNIVGPIEANQNGTKIETENAKYLYSDALVHMDKQVTFKDDKGMMGKVLRATFNPEKSILKGYNFDVKEPTRMAKSDEIYYYLNDKKVELSKNVLVTTDKNSINTQNLVYNNNTKDIEIRSTSKIKYDTYLINSSYAKVNNTIGDVHVRNAHIVSSDKSEFSANETKGNLNDGLIHFTGNVKSTVYSKDEKTNFNGQMLDLYLDKVGDKYQAKKIIMNKLGVFTQLNRKLETDNLEADLIKNIVYLKNRPVLTVDNGEKGDTLGKADIATAYIDTKVLKLAGNVYIKDVNEKKEEIVMTSKRGELKDNIASVYDNVKVTNKESVLTANEGHYDMTTKKARLKGNVHVDYVTQKGAKL